MIHLSADIAALAGPDDARVRALERIIPPRIVQQVLQETARANRRCPVLPHWLVVWLVIGLGLFAPDSYQMIFKRLQRFRKGQTPRRSTLGEARRGLGCCVLRRLAARVVGLPGRPGDPHGFYKGLRLMALDSFTLDLFDSAANARVFGRPGGRRGQGAFPQARVLALCETGSHAIWRYQVKPGRRGEIGMAPVLLRHLQPGMLLLWDRNFFGYEALRQVLARGAHLLCRVKSNLIFAPIEALPDGSYLAKAYASAKHRRHDQGGIVVRVIDYALGDPNRPAKEARHRLVTTLTDAAAYPAEELVVLYHERWEEELAIDEVKTHQKQRATLRSQAPWGVVQGIDGLLLAHYAVRAVMAEAADDAGLSPRQLSFTGSLRVLRLRLAEAPAGRAPRRRWWAALLAEVGELVLEPRRDRINPRVIRRQQSKWPKKRPEHRHHPQPTMPFRHSILIC
jgi:Insertion element 4 transposase N-terminal/Transposase DDE domain